MIFSMEQTSLQALKKAKDSIVKLVENDRFSLDNNEYAQEYYFEHNLKALQTKVKEEMKKTSDLDVKEVNIKVKDVAPVKKTVVQE